jgi:cytochrome c553
MSATPPVTAFALVAALSLGGCTASPDKSEGKQVAGMVHLCSSCHGLTGRSVAPEFPILAAQQADYLEAQLKAFRDHSRADPHAHTYMWGMAAHLDDATITGLAAYFASQPALPARQPANKGASVGRAIFTDGIEGRDIPACIGCHGDKAEGQGTIPRLAGQHQVYLSDQLTHFRSNARNNETMHMNAVNLTDAEIQELAAYLSDL